MALGLAGQLSEAMLVRGSSPLLDRGIVLVSMAIAIALGAASMSDIALLAHLAPLLGTAASSPTVRRTLDLAGDKKIRDRIARARARARAHAWNLIAQTERGFPWLEVAGKTLTGWVVIDMDATLITAHSEKEKAAPTWKKGYGFHPLAAWCRNTRECLAMLLRPGNAGSNTFTDHREVLTAAIRQVPSRFRRRILVRVDGAGASHDLIGHLLSLSSPRRTLRFTCGWTIRPEDEDAIKLLPASAWKPGTCQDGAVEEDKAVAEITHLMTRAENWPGSLRWVVRRVKPSRRQLAKLTPYEKQTGWRYSIICANIPDAGLQGVPGSHHPQYIDVLHREHACVETVGVRTAKDMGLRGLPSKIFQVNEGWVLAANIAADSPPGPASSATKMTRNSATLTRLRCATASGIFPRNSPVMPASAFSRSAPTGPGPTSSLPAGTGSARSPRRPDQHEQSQRRGRSTTPARSEPVPTRARRARHTARPARTNRAYN